MKKLIIAIGVFGIMCVNAQIKQKQPINEMMRISCEQLLNECAECGILDSAGIIRYNEIKAQPNIAAYEELIEECITEDIFFDTVGESDAYINYLNNVYAKRHTNDIK